MKKRDLVTAAFWVIFGLIISIWSFTFPIGTWEEVGPAVLPFACGLILILLGSILFFRVLKQSEGKAKKVVNPIIPYGAAFRRVAITVVGTFISAAIIDFFGFILTVFFLTLFLFRGVQPTKWKVDIFFALVFTSGSYVLFQVLFKTTLPIGFLGF